MKKIYKNFECPKCKSNDIRYIYYTQNTDKNYIENNSKSIKRIRVRYCTCDRCKTKFKVNFNEEYVMYNNPYKPLSNEIKLIASFETEDPNFHNYKLVSFSNKENSHLLIYIDDENPIIVSKGFKDEIIYEINGLYDLDLEPTIDKTLVLNIDNKKI